MACSYIYLQQKQWRHPAVPIYCAPLLRPSAASICCVPLRRPSDASEFGPLRSDGDTTTTATHWWVTSNDVGAEHLSNMGGGADTAASLCCNERNSIGRTTATHWWVTSNDVALQMMLLPNICRTWKVGQIHGVSLLQPAEQYSTKQRVFNGVWTTQRSMAQQRSSPAQRTALPWARRALDETPGGVERSSTARAASGAWCGGA